MTYVFETKISDMDVWIEYTLSSVTGLIKVVDMTVNGKFHRMNWMDRDAKDSLMDDLERDYMDNHSDVNHPDFIEAFNNPTEAEWLESKAELHYGI